jgi:hypothetical protein
VGERRFVVEGLMVGAETGLLVLAGRRRLVLEGVGYIRLLVG